MDLKSALKSKKPFRRQSLGGEWFDIRETPSLLFDADEVVATDWEIDDSPRYVTAKKLEEAYKKSEGDLCKMLNILKLN